MSGPIADLTVKVGERETDNGTKAIYENIGQLFENDRGYYALIKACMLSPSLLTVCNPDNRPSVLIAIFDKDRERGGGGGGSRRSSGGGGGGSGRRSESSSSKPAPSSAPAQGSVLDDDDIPF